MLFVLAAALGAAAGAGAVLWRQRALERRREALLAFAAHELASPTTGVQLALRNLLQGLFGEVSPDQKKWLEVAQDQVAWLGGLAGDVGDLAHLEFGRRLRVTQGAVDLRACLDRAAGEARRLADRWGVALDWTPPASLPAVRSDPDRLSRVAWNLLTHALRFSAPKGAVRLSAQERGGRVEASVEWTPVDPSTAPACLLDRFCVANGSKTLKVSGVGLAVAKEVAERSGARLRAERSGGRDRFILSLPKA